jgi:hypothetical protein
VKARTITTRTAVCATAVAASVVGLSAPASAYDPDIFHRCVSEAISCDGLTSGDITWLNRTAQVSGSVVDEGPGSITAIFEAFAGSTKIDTQTRTTDDASTGSSASPRGFSFAIGDPDLVGGINRIRITVCRNYQTANQGCSPQQNIWRD